MTTENNNTVLKEAENKIEIEGLLLEKDVRTGKSAAGKEFMSVKLQVETKPNEQHTVELFAMKLKANGEENGIYKSLETVANEYKAVKDVGREEADYVTTSTGKIQLNDYVGGDGQLRSFPQISATFINRVENREPEPKATFKVEAVVDRVVEEIDKPTEEETGRAILHTYIALYNGKVIPFEFKVNKDGASYVIDNYEKGDTVYIYGDIINKSEKHVKKIEAAFGQDTEEVTYNYIREFQVVGGSESYEEDNVNRYDTELIKKALVVRENYLEELKNKKDSQAPSGVKQGFDTASSSKPDISDSDLPF